MHVEYLYDPDKEVIALKAGFKSKNSSKLTDFANRSQLSTIDPSNQEEVASLSKEILAENGIDPTLFREPLQEKWNQIEAIVLDRLQKMFRSNWNPGAVTAYLTVSARCPYNVERGFFFVSFLKPAPILTTIHELQHFFCHHLYEREFDLAGKSEQFNDFKESLTVLLNLEFEDLIESPDRGYSQHQDFRKWISAAWVEGKSLEEIKVEWLNGIN